MPTFEKVTVQVALGELLQEAAVMLTLPGALHPGQPYGVSEAA